MIYEATENILLKQAIAAASGSPFNPLEVTDTYQTESNNLLALLITKISGGAGVANYPYVNVVDFGAIGDGVFNCYNAFLDAVATGKNIYVPSGTFLITPPTINGVMLQAKQSVFGIGINSIVKTTGNNVIFRTNDDNTISNLKFLGSGKNDAGKPFQTGIFHYQKNKGLVVNCNFEDFAGTGSDEYYGGGVAISSINSGIHFYQSLKVSKCNFVNNGVGVYLSRQGEYAMIDNCIINKNNIGVLATGGNYSISNNVICENTLAFKFSQYLNSGHGVVSNCLINHNTKICQIVGLTEGHTFNGCMMYYGIVEITNSKLVKFVACDFQATTHNLTNNTKLLLSNSRFEVAPTPQPNVINLISGENYTLANNLQ